ncbi:YifB family Mg chelatase-like AAA ATPase [Flexivirga caeni]|uniref:ATP-binding protein n=1 Tax=Flexivirga caeni TaxID=2294115 RepID=A0A3M9MHI7_9MICO|nr:YifB family Mg chelatase-like AAA ATPase [Flexivirga caeni]RNI24323.1 ATP-binding protein [Flexivirga caeni]
MSLGRTRSVAVTGIHGCVVEVEADVSPGLPTFYVSGMPDASCKQAPDRIRAAANNCDLELPRQRITVNLSPASLPKHGSGFDLAIAVAALASGGTIKPELVSAVVHLGELGLDGSVRPIQGVLPAVRAAQQAGARRVVVPAANAAEASLVPDIEVVPADSIATLVARYRALARGRPLPELPAVPKPCGAVRTAPDLVDIVGQSEARYALEVAAAGGHHLAMIGPPGAGKTMIAERLPGLLPPLTREQSLEVTAIHSVLGALPDQVLIEQPPFVAPHHGASMAAVIGGGSGRVRPGAVSRAHRGVMFLDECPEFRRDVLDALRQPLESGEVRVARADQVVTFPARFQLVLAANPCPCGQNYGKGTKCTCAPQRRRDYLSRMSGPLLDRVDVQLTMLPVTRASLAGPRGESSAQVAERVVAARRRQAERWAPLGYARNGEVPGTRLRNGEWRLSAADTRGLDQAMELGQLTLRGYDRCLRVAWTISDLDGAQRPGFRQVEEARGLRAGSAAA